MALTLAPSPVEAHTTMSNASPGDGDTLSGSPPAIVLTFNGKLEETNPLHAIQVAGPDGETALELPSPTLSDDRKTLSVALPELANGTYAVTYRAISGDGHPVEGGYSFAVAGPEPAPAPEEENALVEPDAPKTGAPPADEAAPVTDEHEEHDGHDGADEHADGRDGAFHRSAGDGTLLGLLFASRILYYATLLPLLGWALWSAFLRQTAGEFTGWRRTGLWLQGSHAAAFAIHVATQWAEMSWGGATASLADVLRDTALGQSWLFTGLLALAGFPLLFRYRVVDGAWAALVIGAKTLRGHASAFEPVALARLADAAHLGAAAIWIGGLLALALFARRAPDRLRAFAPTFSNAALAAFAVLAATGVVSTLLYTERLEDIARTTWGWLLLAKLVLAAAILPVAALLRRRLRAEASAPSSFFRRWLRVDVALLAGIVAITGVLTHVSPVVERVPFRWHVMGDEAHLTADIADLRAGSNELSLKVWVPTDDGGAPEVSATIVTSGETGEAAAEASVGLAVVDIPAEEWESFPGFDKYTFVGAVGISDPAAASLRIVIERANGETLTYERKIIEP
ncbi:copper resistance protein CopC/CopD [Paenibacillus sp. TRM 82003]|nr:copper resistance protein CopC/CopD [Paenibacillus sp. TRM 82003]